MGVTLLSSLPTGPPLFLLSEGSLRAVTQILLFPGAPAWPPGCAAEKWSTCCLLAPGILSYLSTLNLPFPVLGPTPQSLKVCAPFSCCALLTFLPSFVYSEPPGYCKGGSLLPIFSTWNVVGACYLLTNWTKSDPPGCYDNRCFCLWRSQGHTATFLNPTWSPCSL